MVAERFFKKEVLGRRGPLQIFETESVKTFIYQLKLHGFSKMEGDLQYLPHLMNFNPFTPGLGLPAFPFGHPYSAAMQAPWASLLPFRDPWLSMSMLAAAAAVAMPRPPPSQAPAYRHCPTSTCHPNSAAAA
ncbi:uncharacterized protein J5F26_003668 [Ciconia maguari]